MPRCTIHALVALVLAVAAAAPALFAAPSSRAAAQRAPIQLITYDTCIRVIEGDLIEGKQVGLIRLIGVIAPAEGEAGWRDATDYTRKLAVGKRIRIEICSQRPNDFRDRLRAVVFLPDGANLNAKVLRVGMARVLERAPCHVDAKAWRAYESEARKAGRGLWKSAAAPAAQKRPNRATSSGSVTIRPRR